MNFRGFVLVVLFGTLVPSGIAAEAETLTWLVLDVPPSMILSGPFEGQGNIDVIRKTIAAQMPEYNHILQAENIARVTDDLKRLDHVASPGLLFTADRQNLFTLSVPVSIVPSIMLIVTRDKRHLFTPFLDAAGTLDLGEFLASRKLTLGMALGRQYSGGIDDVLARYKGSPQIVERSGADISQGLVRLLSSARIDACLLFPFEAQYVGRIQGVAQNLTAIPIKGVPPFAVTVVVAPATPWGREFIGKVNKVVLAHRTTTFVEALVPWLDSETVALYRRWASEFFTQAANSANR